MEQIEKRVKALAALMSISTAANLLNLRAGEPLQGQLLILLPIVFISWIVIYHFYYGRNWARILVLIGSIFSLSNFLFVLAAQNAMQFIFSMFDGFLAIYLLSFVTQPETKTWFKVKSAEQPKKSGVRVAMTVAIILIALAGAAVAGVSTLMRKLDKTQIWMEEMADGEGTRLTSGGMNTSPVFSSDGQKVLFVNRPEGTKGQGPARIQLYSADGRLETLFESKEPVWGTSWAADGKSILFTMGEKKRALWRYTPETKGLERLTEERTEGQSDPMISPDGRWLLGVDQDAKGRKYLVVAPFAGGDKKKVSEPGNFLHEPKYPAWSADSQKIAYLSFMSLIIYDIQTGQNETVALEGLNNVMDIVFYPADTDKLLVKARPVESTSFSYNLYLVSRKTGRVEILKQRRKMMEMQYDISSDGSKLVYSRA